MKIHEVTQGSQDWFDLRLGKATASRFKDILAALKSNGESAARAGYRAELVVERLTGQTPERYRSQAMEYGSETEELARTTYTLETGNIVDPAPFFEHDTLAAGASPDGLVGEIGTLEIKCYDLHNHIAALRSGHMPEKHKAQVQGQLWLTGREWCDFVSFAPELPENAQLFIERVSRDDDYITRLEHSVLLFLDEVQNEVDFVRYYHSRREVAA